jgi:hypothetical protein
LIDWLKLVWFSYGQKQKTEGGSIREESFQAQIKERSSLMLHPFIKNEE